MPRVLTAIASRQEHAELEEDGSVIFHVKFNGVTKKGNTRTMIALIRKVETDDLGYLYYAFVFPERLL